MTTVELQAAIRSVIEPLSASVEKLGDKFDEHRLKMTEDVTEIKTDIKYLKDNQKNTDEWIDNLRDRTASFKKQPKESVSPASTKTTSSTTNDNSSIRIPVPSRYLPWLIMSVILGAALAGGLLFGGGKVAVPSQTTPPAAASTNVEKASSAPSISDTAQRAAAAAKAAADAAHAMESVWSPSSPSPPSETMEESR